MHPVGSYYTDSATLMVPEGLDKLAFTVYTYTVQRKRNTNNKMER
jgi:hypothetical protein